MDGSEGSVLCFLLYRPLAGYVNVPTGTNVLWLVWLGTTPVVGMPLVLLSMLLSGLWSVGIVGVVGTFESGVWVRGSFDSVNLRSARGGNASRN